MSALALGYAGWGPGQLDDEIQRNGWLCVGCRSSKPRSWDDPPVPTGGIDFRALITATPETESSSHMFYAQVRNFAHDDDALTETFTNDFYNVFMQDVGAMEAQQRVRERHPDGPTVDINVDAPHLAMQQLIRKLIETEQTSAPA